MPRRTGYIGTVPELGATPATPSAGFLTGPYAKSGERRLHTVDSGGFEHMLERAYAFMRVPRGSLDSWRAAKAAAGARLVNVVGWGDSLFAYYSSNFRELGFFGKIIADLQTPYGDGGDGFQSAVNATGIGATGATYMTLTGTWTNAGASAPNERFMYPSATTGGDRTWATPGVKGRYLDFHNIRAASGVTYKVRKDGGADTTITPATGGNLWHIGGTFDLGDAAAHDILVTINNPNQPWFAGFNARNTVGIIGHNMGHTGRTSGAGAVSSFPAYTGQLTGHQSITEFNPDLVIIMLGPNDATASVARDTYCQNVGRLMKFARMGANKGACDIIVIAAHMGGISGNAIGDLDTSHFYPRYVEAMAGLCDSFNAVFFDAWGMGRNNWTYWNDLSYWGITNGSTGAAGTDGLHLSNAGMAALAAPVTELLLAA